MTNDYMDLRIALAEIDRLKEAMRLAECQYLGAGGNLNDKEIVHHMRWILYDALNQ